MFSTDVINVLKMNNERNGEMDIVQLLDENSKMKIDLLELIQTKLGEKVEISFLAQKTAISKFKLGKLINELKMDLQQKLSFDNIFTFKRGVIQVNSFICDEDILKLRQQYLDNSLIYQLLIFLLFSNKPINKFIAEHYISNSSLYLYKKRINKLLEKEHLLIKKNKIMGNEWKIRSVGYSIIHDLNGMGYPFTEQQKAQSDRFVLWIEQFFKIRIRNSLRYKLSLFLSVSALRIQKKAYFNESNVTIKVDMTAPLIQHLAWKLKAEYQVSDTIALREAAVLYIYLYVNRIIHNKTYLDFSELKPTLSTFNHNYLNMIREIANVISLDYRLLNTLVKEVQPIHERLLFMPDIHHSFRSIHNFQFLQEEYPLFDQKVKETILKTTNAVLLNEEEKTDLYICYMMELIEKFPLEAIEEAVYIALDFSYGKAYEEFIAEHLQYSLAGKIVIEKVISSKTDVYISDFHLGNLQCKTILWQRLPNHHNWQELITQIKKIILEKNVKKREGTLISQQSASMLE
ncbi:helix-turn-helix domain-containing protein [Enterococcus ratti]|uniref:helix-turn-helix domain-containing protein n=1 Tax=Enterococcus ratti TaxID=150033 RepID=UPI0035190751